MAVDAPRTPQETRATRWARIMPRGGGGRPHSWGAFFRDWLDQQEIFVQDWPYAGLDFRNDPDLVLPPGEQWDDAGMTLRLFEFCIVFYFYVHVLINVLLCRCGAY